MISTLEVFIQIYCRAKVEISPPSICTNTAEVQNSSCASFDQLTVNTESFTSQDRELIFILDDLQKVSLTVPSNNTETTRLIGHFCSDTVFNLSKRVLTDAEISFYRKALTMPLSIIKLMNQN